MGIEDVIRARGPLTVAAFMELALYDPHFGYYTRAIQRSGRAGDFFTSVDVGPLFGELLETQIEEMWRLLNAAGGDASDVRPFALVEAGAGNGRLSADILRAARERHPAMYRDIRLHLVETSGEARLAQASALDGLSDRLMSSTDALPPPFEGVLVANELFDALPTHQVVMRDEGLREIYVDVERPGGARVPSRTPPIFDRPERGPTTTDGRLTTLEGPLSTPALADYLARVGASLETGWRAEINLRAVEWIREAARRLTRGFMIIVDYGHEARDLYAAGHSDGTLSTFSRHTMAGPESAGPGWLARPGEQDLTAHVDFTSLLAAAAEEGVDPLGFMDQTYFLLGLVDSAALLSLHQRLALKTLTMPGGLGSTHKVLLLGKNVGAPSLRGGSFARRVT